MKKQTEESFMNSSSHAQCFLKLPFIFFPMDTPTGKVGTRFFSCLNGVHTTKEEACMPVWLSFKMMAASARGNKKEGMWWLGMIQEDPPKDITFHMGLKGGIGEEGEEHFGQWE